MAQFLLKWRKRYSQELVEKGGDPEEIVKEKGLFKFQMKANYLKLLTEVLG